MTLALSDLLRGIGLDRYDIMARLRPALITALPIVVVVAYWFPQVRTMGGSIVSVLGACGLTYLLAQVARHRGRAFERRLGDRAGRLHSARLLTFADGTIAAETKKRYHAALRAKGCPMSTPEQEKKDPATAFTRARSAVDWLLVYTLPNVKKSLLFEDNIAYGFCRNLYGMKPIAIAVLLLTISVNAALLAASLPDRAALVNGLSIEAVLLGLLALWLFAVTVGWVCQASLAYAQRLFNQCESPAEVKT